MVVNAGLPSQRSSNDGHELTSSATNVMFISTRLVIIGITFITVRGLVQQNENVIVKWNYQLSTEQKARLIVRDSMNKEFRKKNCAKLVSRKASQPTVLLPVTMGSDNRDETEKAVLASQSLGNFEV